MWPMRKARCARFSNECHPYLLYHAMPYHPARLCTEGRNSACHSYLQFQGLAAVLCRRTCDAMPYACADERWHR